MLKPSEFLDITGLDEATLEIWLASGWIVCEGEGKARTFAHIDVARARLIHDLRNRLAVNDEAVPVVLDLVDQIHGLRRAMHGMLHAVCKQPDHIRADILAALRAADEQVASSSKAPAPRKRRPLRKS